MSRMPPPEGHHGPPPISHTYEPTWRPPYAPQYDPHGHGPDRRPSSTNQATLPPPNYPAMPGRELPQLHLDGPYSRTASLPGPGPGPGPGPPVQDAHAAQHAFRPPMNGASHEATPHSAPPEYRAPRIGYQPPEPPGPGETTPTSGPLPPPSQFMSPAPIAAPTPAPYGPDYYQNPAYGHRQRKAARAQQACDQCRARKAKCDEGRPECSHCRENGLKCVYKEIPTHKQEKSMQPVMTSIMHFRDEAMQDTKRLLRGQEHNTNQLDRLVSQLTQLINTQGIPVTDPNRLSQTAAPIPPHELPVKLESQVIPPMEQSTEKSPFGQQQRLDTVSFDESQLKGDNEGELSIPLEHTTAAHKLLMWPSIKKLLNPHDYDKDYVMGLEGQRGVTSLFHRGENSYSADGSFLPWRGSPMNGNMNSQRQSGLEAWAGAALQDSDADISRNGILRLDGKTVKRYLRSYLSQMHLLHPFLDQRELEEKVDTFIQCYCPTDTNSLCREKKRKRSVEDVDGSGRDGSSTPPVGLNIDCAIVLLTIAVGAICETKSPLPGPVMDKEPDYRQQFIPGPRQPIPPAVNGTNTINGFLSPANSDSALPSNASFYAPLESTSQSFPSSATEARAADKAMLQRSTMYDKKPKNYQMIPGLSLYSYALQILAFLHSGIHLEHVQANLLAGLYAGQLAHPFSSHSHIHKAAWACQVLVGSKDYKALQGGPTQDLFNFVYWTCLQLESDLLAELDIPASGISRSESLIPLPKGKWTIIPLPNDMEDPHVMMMMFYSAQIHLRKVLNRVHTDLYKVEKEGQARWSSSVQEALSHNLDLWRFSLPEMMRWKDDYPPAKEINAARMRAKYYGARYIIHRPLLYHALHYGGSGARVDAVSQTSVDSPTGSVANSQSQQMSPSVNTTSRAQNMTRMMSDMGTVSSNPAAAFPNGWTPPTVHLRELPSKLRRACKVCIDSAILSTKAFDGIEDPFDALENNFKEEPFKSMQDPLEGHRMEDPFAMDPNFVSKDEKNRLVVTNIFGTAHAQFGNLLVLSATYMSSLSELVDRDELKTLLKRTIRFLLRSEHVSPTLRADARILTEIYQKIFHHSPTLENPNTP
ncbi:uncharacterized protein N7469_003740 [Penicillium citrinum]|uniref:Zn(2)-C6 fungal-type domain-containing protein n=1 Tax=Penicillium citrinum TaxID=5077 RepID=A0A9W9P3A0_PENCI|nr:uncharacterized protein N7469_003740 [Penicillium citrinum]KAJ5234572.1 hypothetical protein N7469_003740 [Penicillium citrinum]